MDYRLTKDQRNQRSISRYAQYHTGSQHADANLRTIHFIYAIPIKMQMQW